ncbi:hypothetical protein FEM03_20870 [Phragmitibacter flavus]|uniref:Uncharacterized protein n=1 Tax=Phragmitibacter flavus TaxID=2576071 RepID=A0A5R8KB66_9BACT|nr:hypothetical protein [Phragmitibacter flavus]TLD68789.1 hypothetical protein FEM03_20870 [Phragmitibacter flavus]
MPLTELVCPHCESTVEVQVTSVTRSRECPHCGRLIVLQFATKVTGSKRRALLMPTKEISRASGAPVAAAVQPISLENDVQKRLMHDPEVRSIASILRVGIFVVLGLVVVLMAGHWLKWWPWLNGGDEATVASTNVSREPVGKSSRAELAKDGVVQLTGNAEMDAALLRAQEFLEAKTVEDRLKLVRDRELMEEKIRGYYAAKGDGPIAYERVLPDRGAVAGSTSFIFQVVLPTGAERQMMLTTPAGGKPVVDWSSFVVYSDMDWVEWMKEKPTSPRVFRVLAARDEFFAGSFSDTDTLRCLKLFDPLSKDSPPIFAYYERASPVGREMEFVMSQSGGQALPMTLALRYPPYGSAENQVWVEERIAEGWVARGR